MNSAKNRLGKKNTIIILVALSVMGSLAILAVVAKSSNNNTVDVNYSGTVGRANLDADHLVDDVPSLAVLQNTTADTERQLLYLIEEEKLAHDVYLKMYEKYGARTFSNILKSETNHQERVLSLLIVRDITNPLSPKVGVFNDQSLQKLYDELIARGNISLAEAYKVGVAIEELDISDIKQDLAMLDPAQTDIKSTLETLLRGSENHLRAFSRQVR